MNSRKKSEDTSELLKCLSIRLSIRLCFIIGLASHIVAMVYEQIRNDMLSN